MNMELKTTLNEEMTKRYSCVREYLGMKSDQSIVSFLISEEYNKIQNAARKRVFIDAKTYDLAELTAKARGQSLEDYIDQACEEMLKHAKEGVKHGNPTDRQNG